MRLKALALSRRLGDPETLAIAGLSLILPFAPEHWDERLHLAQEAVGWPRDGVRSTYLGPTLGFSAKALLANGERARAEEMWRQLRELAGRTHLATVNLQVSRSDAALAIVDGRLEEALDSQRGFVERADACGAAVSSRQVALTMLLPSAIYLGRAEVWLAAYDEFAELAGPAAQAVEFSDARAICLAHLGRLDEARGLVGARLEHVEQRPDVDELPVHTLVWLLEAAALLGEQPAALALSARLACIAHLSITEGACSHVQPAIWEMPRRYWEIVQLRVRTTRRHWKPQAKSASVRNWPGRICGLPSYWWQTRATPPARRRERIWMSRSLNSRICTCNRPSNARRLCETNSRLRLKSALPRGPDSKHSLAGSAKLPG
jgi:hypothetical protein